MAILNDRQLKILRVIDAGSITGEDIVKALGSSMQMTSYYLNTLADDGYLKVARVYDNETRDFIVVRAYLTDQGKTTLESATPKSDALSEAPASSAAPVPNPPVSAPVPNPDAPLVSDRPAVIDYARIAQSIAQINSQIETVPIARRELLEVYLEDLQNEVNVAYRRKLIRMKAYFLAILNVLSPMLKQGNEAFRQPLETIAAQLQLPIQLP
jgi:DeoR family transcriptional regulator, catabolite repression regulator